MNIQEIEARISMGTHPYPPSVVLYTHERCRQGYISSQAKELLDLKNGDRVRFAKDVDSGQAYIGKTDRRAGFKVSRQGKIACGCLRNKLALPLGEIVYFRINPDKRERLGEDHVFGMDLISEEELMEQVA